MKKCQKKNTLNSLAPENRLEIVLPSEEEVEKALAILRARKWPAKKARRCGLGSSLDDLFQEVYARALARLYLYDPNRSLVGWLGGILNNRLIDWQRKAKVRKTRSLFGADGKLAINPVARPGIDEEDVQEKLRLVAQTLTEVSEVVREVAVRRCRGMSNIQIGLELEMKPGAVASAFRRFKVAVLAKVAVE